MAAVAFNIDEAERTHSKAIAQMPAANKTDPTKFNKRHSSCFQATAA